MTKDQQNNGALYAQNYEELKHQMKTLLRLIGLYELYVQHQTPGSEEAAHAAGMLALYRRHFAQLTGREVKAEEVAAVMQTRKEIVKRLKEPDAEDAAENARDGEQEEVVVDFNPNHGDNGQFTSGAGRHRAGNQRATKGNPRAKTQQSNIPSKLPANATDGQLERQLKKVLDAADAHKGNQVVSRGKETYVITQERSDHRKDHQKEKVNNEQIAKTVTQGNFEKSWSNALAYRKNTKVVKQGESKKGTDLTTSYHEKEYRNTYKKGKPQT